MGLGRRIGSPRRISATRPAGFGYVELCSSLGNPDTCINICIYRPHVFLAVSKAFLFTCCRRFTISLSFCLFHCRFPSLPLIFLVECLIAFHRAATLTYLAVALHVRQAFFWAASSPSSTFSLSFTAQVTRSMQQLQEAWTSAQGLQFCQGKDLLCSNGCSSS